VKPVQDSDVPQVRYSFTPIDHLQDVPADQLVDVLGVITSVGESSSAKAKKDGRSITKRSVTIVDNTMRRVELTLWADKADNFSHPEGTVFLAKNLRVTEFMGKKGLTVAHNSQTDFNPANTEASELLTWYQKNRQEILSGGAPSISMSSDFGDGGSRTTPLGTLQEIADEVGQLSSEGAGTKTVYKKVVCTLFWIKHDEGSPIYYKAVPLSNQRQKVVERNGKYFCQATNVEYDSYIPRFVLTVLGSDSSSAQFLSVFDDCGPSILGVDAKYVEQLKEPGPNQNDQKFNAIFQAAVHQRFVLKLKANEEVYGDSQKLKFTVIAVEKPDYAQLSRNIIANLKNYF